MKKFFTLVFGVLFTLCINAATLDAGSPTNNAKGVFDETTKVITFAAAGDYKPGWWMAWDNKVQDNIGQDYSKYDEFVVELEPTDFEITLYFEYMDEAIVATPVSSKSGKIVMPLDAEGKKKVKQAYLQVGEDGVGKPVQFKSAYFQNNEAEATSAVFFDAPATNPLDWDDNKVSASLTDDALALLKEGNVLRIEYKKYAFDSEDDRYYQVQVMGSWWTILNSTFAMAGVEAGAKNAIINLDDTGVLDVKLDAADIATLKQQKGILLAGHGILVQKMTVMAAPATGISNAIVAPRVSSNAPIYNLAGQQVSKAYKGVVVKNGKKYVQK